MENVIKPVVIIKYNNNDVTSDLLPFVTSIDYIDKVNGESDTLSIKIADFDGRFLDNWFPEKGDTLELSIGYDSKVMPTGIFEIDQVEINGPPLSVSLMAIAAPVSKAIRTIKSYAHEDSSLLKIAQTVAEQNGLEISGDIDPNIKIKRSTQNRETDLAYLFRLANAYGYGFNVRGDSLVFYSFYELEALEVKRTISISEVISFSFRQKTADVYNSAVVKYHNPDNQKLITYEDTDGANTSDKLEVFIKSKSFAEAATQAKAALFIKNTKKTMANIVVLGDPTLLAGNNIELINIGVFSGTYHIISSRHSVTPAGGYGTSSELYKIN